MPPAEFGKQLTGLMISLLVRDLERAIEFHREVLQVEFIYHDPDLAIVRGYGSLWMVHADHTYDNHALLADTLGHERRGAGVELRLHGCDPDGAAARAIEHGFEVMDGPRDQPDHGLREAHIVDGDGYVWVPDLHC